MPKYKNQNNEIATNNNELYRQLFKDRGINSHSIEQYRTHQFNTDFNKDTVATFEHTWSMGDRFYKLAHQYYGEYKFWWVIALFNNKPTEAHCSYGDVLLIPANPTDIINGGI